MGHRGAVPEQYCVFGLRSHLVLERRPLARPACRSLSAGEPLRHPVGRMDGRDIRCSSFIASTALAVELLGNTATTGISRSTCRNCSRAAIPAGELTSRTTNSGGPESGAGRLHSCRQRQPDIQCSSARIKGPGDSRATAGDPSLHADLGSRGRASQMKHGAILPSVTKKTAVLFSTPRCCHLLGDDRRDDDASIPCRPRRPPTGSGRDAAAFRRHVRRPVRFHPHPR